MKAIFADSFYDLALLNPSDNAHESARGFSATYEGRIVTTAWALTEVGDALAGPRSRRIFLSLIEQIQIDPKTTMLGPSLSLFGKGIDLYSRRPDKEWSLTDCISFVVMGERGLSDALTGDHHFDQAGFKALLRSK